MTRAGDGVSRETSPPPPPAVAAPICGEHLEAMVAYAALLAGPAVERGLLGPRELPRLWMRHLLNCAVVATDLAPGCRVVDVGSGAGLPGLVWALLRPDVRVVLLDPLLRRAVFLTEAVAALGLDTVQVDRIRAEQVPRRYAADVVTARAVAPLDRLLGWTLPLLRPGGRLLAFKGRSASAELAAAAPTLAAWGGAAARLRTYGEGMLDPPTRIVEVTTSSEKQVLPRRGPGREDERGRRGR